MKKIILSLLFSVLALSFVSAQISLDSVDDVKDSTKDVVEKTEEVAELANDAIEEANAGTFPLGEWLDPNYDALWIFQNGNIFLKQHGELVFDFKDMMSDFKLGATMEGTAKIDYRCDDTGRDYTFSMKKGSTDMMMHITKDSGIEYDITMKKQ